MQTTDWRGIQDLVLLFKCSIRTVMVTQESALITGVFADTL